MTLPAPSLADLNAELARRELAEFVRQSWHVLEPGVPLEWNWHLDAICLHVQAALEDWMRRQREPAFVQRFQNLAINVPPGSMKSRIVSVCAPAWMWAKWPSWRAIFLSANPRVALRDSVYCRDLIRSEWYRGLFKPGWTLKEDQDAKSKYDNTAGGFRMAMGITSRITGDRADVIFVDDPHDADEVHSKLKREEVLDRWDSAIANRVNDLRSSVRIGIMQRLHEEDWTGHVLKQGGWEHLSIPQEFDPSQARTTAIGWRDPRTVEGELMFPARFPAHVLAQEKRRLGSAGYAGQHQQRPAPASGNVFRREWFKRYRVAPSDLDTVILSWDCAFKGASDSDYVVGQVWGRKGADKYLLAQVRAQMGFAATLAAFKDLATAWPAASAKYVEDKANGPAIIETLQREFPGVIPVNPEGGKEARAAAVSPQVEAGNVWLPESADWVADFIEECCVFPRGAHDDQVDAMTQALNRLSQSGFAFV